MIRDIKGIYFGIQRMILDSRASSELSRLGVGFIPWSRSAIQPASLVWILNEIMINNRTRIVEFGSGVSTVYIAKVLSIYGGSITTIDHDKEWINYIKKILIREGVSGVVEMVHAPLTESVSSVKGLLWYEGNAVKAALHGNAIDFALIDGPPAHESEKALARYPAFAALRGNLAERCAIFLDDIDRSGEKQILSMWEEAANKDFVKNIERIPNIGILRRGKSYNINYS